MQKLIGRILEQVSLPVRNISLLSTVVALGSYNLFGRGEISVHSDETPTPKISVEDRKSFMYE